MKKFNLFSAAAATALLLGAGQVYAQDAMPTKPATDPATAPTTATPAAPAPTVQEPMTATPPAATAPAATPAPAAPAAPTAAMVVAKGDIVSTLKASGQFTTLLKALDATNLTKTVSTSPNLTLFAPTDAAFAALPAGELDRLMANPTELQKVLTYHVVNASIEESKLKGAKGPVNTVANTPLVLDGSGDKLMAGNATVTQGNIHATNGIIYVVDKVLSPTGTPMATNMSTDRYEGGIIRASWQAEPAMPMTAPANNSAPQQAPTEPTEEPADTATDAAAPAMPATDAVAAPTDATMDTTTAVAAATAEPTVVTNGPVLDTAENRAKYPPTSRAGKRSAAKGN